MKVLTDALSTTSLRYTGPPASQCSEKNPSATLPSTLPSSLRCLSAGSPGTTLPLRAPDLKLSDDRAAPSSPSEDPLLRFPFLADDGAGDAAISESSTVRRAGRAKVRFRR